MSEIPKSAVFVGKGSPTKDFLRSLSPAARTREAMMRFDRFSETLNDRGKDIAQKIRPAIKASALVANIGRSAQEIMIVATAAVGVGYLAGTKEGRIFVGQKTTNVSNWVGERVRTILGKARAPEKHIENQPVIRVATRRIAIRPDEIQQWLDANQGKTRHDAIQAITAAKNPPPTA